MHGIYKQHKSRRRSIPITYKMWEQIKETVRYFRNKGIIDADKIVQAVMSFPNLIGNFEQWVFPIRQEDGTMKTAMDISRC